MKLWLMSLALEKARGAAEVPKMERVMLQRTLRNFKTIPEREKDPRVQLFIATIVEFGDTWQKIAEDGPDVRVNVAHLTPTGEMKGTATVVHTTVDAHPDMAIDNVLYLVAVADLTDTPKEVSGTRDDMIIETRSSSQKSTCRDARTKHPHDGRREALLGDPLMNEGA